MNYSFSVFYGEPVGRGGIRVNAGKWGKGEGSLM